MPVEIKAGVGEGEGDADWKEAEAPLAALLILGIAIPNTANNKPTRTIMPNLRSPAGRCTDMRFLPVRWGAGIVIREGFSRHPGGFERFVPTPCKEEMYLGVIGDDAQIPQGTNFVCKHLLNGLDLIIKHHPEHRGKVVVVLGMRVRQQLFIVR